MATINGLLPNKKVATSVGDKPDTDFGVTDKALGLAQGNEFDESARPYKILRLRNPPPNCSPEVDVDRNPYNQIPFGGTHPWELVGPHPDHAGDVSTNVSGWLDYTLTLRTPLFVPASQSDRNSANPLRFCTMHDADGNRKYAIPGTGLKGAFRSLVEATTNSRFGAIDAQALTNKHVYRRRQLQTAGVVKKNADGSFTVRKVLLVYVRSVDWPGGYTWPDSYKKLVKINDYNQVVSNQRAVPTNYVASPPLSLRPAGIALKSLEYKGSLLVQPDKNGKYSHVILEDLGQPLLTLPSPTEEEYRALLDHPHFQAHYDREYNNVVDPSKNCYVSSNLSFQTIKAQLQLSDGDLIFFTHAGENVTTFGKNVNYVWPARCSPYDLIKNFCPLTNISLSGELNIAELLFGFAGKHQPNSYPFRGLVTVGCAWGPPAHSPEQEAQRQITLAPLTSPGVRAKSRPLYLNPHKNKLSASYDDLGVAMRGRKFYWHQHTDGQIPLLHQWKDNCYAESQLAAPIQPLPPHTEPFRGRISFRNLPKLLLGALIQTLEGESVDHCIKIGKGKPRGLGSVRFSVEKIQIVNLGSRYSSLDSEAGIEDLDNLKVSACQEFTNWQSVQPNGDIVAKAHRVLGKFPARGSLRYYPLNFAMYGWLPDSSPGNTNGEPKGGIPERPKAMTPASDL